MENIKKLKNIRFSKGSIELIKCLRAESNNGQKVITMTDPQLAQASSLSVESIIVQLTRFCNIGIISRKTHHRNSGCDREITFNADYLKSITDLFPSNSLKEIMFNDTDIKLISYLDTETHQGKKVINHGDAEINEYLGHTCGASLRRLDSIGIISREYEGGAYVGKTGRTRLIKFHADKVYNLLQLLSKKEIA